MNRLLGGSVPITIILHLLYLLLTDLLPALSFLFIYLPRVQAVIGQLMASKAEHAKVKSLRVQR